MGHMTYFIFEPPVPSLGIRRIPNFFELRTLSIKLQNILRFRFLKFGLVFSLDAKLLHRQIIECI
jgi:hypothetical protein